MTPRRSSARLSGRRRRIAMRMRLRRRDDRHYPTGSCFDHVRQAIEDLRTLGIGRTDRVAIVLPNGPTWRSVFLAVAAGATCAPLNPAYRALEFEFYLTDTRAKALVILAGLESPSRDVARSLGIPIIDAAFRRKRASRQRSVCRATRQHAWSDLDLPDADDVALSCTRPERRRGPRSCPLTQRNLCASAPNTSRRRCS